MNSDPGDLSNLRDIAMPDPIGFWPPAAGWWVLGGGALAGMAVLAWRAVARYRADAYRRDALRALDGLEVAAGTSDGTIEVGAVLGILKRAALVAFARPVVASLSGAAWLSFLDATGAPTTHFTRLPGLTETAYGRTGKLDREQAHHLIEAARQWLLRHGRDGPPC